MKAVLWSQCLLCAFLLAVALFLIAKNCQRTTEAGAFGITTVFNDTFEDLSNNVFGEYFDE